MRASVGRLAANVLAQQLAREPDMNQAHYFTASPPRMGRRPLSATPSNMWAARIIQHQAFRAINPAPWCRCWWRGARLWETDAIVCRLSEGLDSDFWRTRRGEAILWISWSAYHLTGQRTRSFTVVCPPIRRNTRRQCWTRRFRTSDPCSDAGRAHLAGGPGF